MRLASVGYPGDTKKYDVRAFVISTKTKVPGLENTPSFSDFDMDPALDEISMWRGYAVKKGTSSGMVEWFQDLCHKVSAVPNGSITWNPTSSPPLQKR